MNEALLSVLLCPCCGGRFRWEPVGAVPGWGALECRRRRHPVVEEIAVLRQGPAASAALEAIERGDLGGALGAALAAAPSSAAGRLLGGLGAYLLRGSSLTPLAAARLGAKLYGDAAPPTFRAQNRALFGRGPRGEPTAADGFARQRSDPAFVAAEALAVALLPRKEPALDLACGVGHLSASLTEASDGSLVAGIDSAFPALLLARRFVAPQAALICADADMPLPFRDGAFGLVMCSGAFLGFPYLPMAAREIARVLSATGGVACLTHLPGRDAVVDGPAGLGLSPEDYPDALAPLAVSFAGESEVLATALGEGRSTVGLSAAPSELPASARLVAVGGDSAPRELTFEGPVPPVTVGPMVWNPLYEAPRVDAAEGLRVLARSPYRYPDEPASGTIPGLLPETVRLPLAFEDPGYVAETAPDLLASLLSQRVVLTLPAGMVEPGRALPKRPGRSGHERGSPS